jgi:hypothetical protein
MYYLLEEISYLSQATYVWYQNRQSSFNSERIDLAIPQGGQFFSPHPHPPTFQPKTLRIVGRGCGSST